MPTLNFQGSTYECAVAQKGKDFIRLLDEENNIVFLRTKSLISPIMC